MATISRFSQVCATDWMLMAFTEIQEKSLLKSEASPSLLPLHANIHSIFSCLCSCIPVCPLHFQVLCVFPSESLPIAILLHSFYHSQSSPGVPQTQLHPCLLSELPISFFLCKFTHHSQTAFFHFIEVLLTVLDAQSCPTLCIHMD